MKGIEIIEFNLGGLTLQEPMAIIFNWLLSAVCMFAFLKIDRTKNVFTSNWSYFFLVFSITTFVGGFGHAFAGIIGIAAKFPHWLGGIISSIFASRGMVSLLKAGKTKQVLSVIIYVKALLLIVLAYARVNFIFIAIDSITTYLLYCGIIAAMQLKKGLKAMKYFVIGVLVCIPSAFVYILKIDLSIWFNRDDLSHVFMLACLIFFFVGTKKMETFVLQD